MIMFTRFSERIFNTNCYTGYIYFSGLYDDDIKLFIVVLINQEASNNYLKIDVSSLPLVS